MSGSGTSLKARSLGGRARLNRVSIDPYTTEGADGNPDATPVDKRGRPVKASHHADQLKRFYRMRSPSPTASSSKDVGFVDYARGEGALSSSGSEDGGEDEESDIEQDELELGVTKKRLPKFGSDEESESESNDSHLEIDLSEDEAPALPPEIDESEEEAEAAKPTERIAAVNLDWDNLRAGDLFAAFNSFLKTAGALDGRLLNVRIFPSEFGKARMEKEEAEGPAGGIFAGKMGRGKKDRRKEGLVKQQYLEGEEDAEDEASDLEDGTEDESLDENDEDESRAEDEDDSGHSEEEGDDDLQDDGDGDRRANRTVHTAKEIDGLEIVSDISSQAGEGDIDMDQLRQYQLERLRYYYAIATFSTISAARHVMEECNGTEFERTANMMDLSYVPDNMDFADDEVKDEATTELTGYKGNDFVTDALRHSKVKLTWDQDDPNRIKVTRRNLTREEIEEQDFKAFVASSGSEEEDEDDLVPQLDTAAAPTNGKLRGKSDKRAAKERTQKLRDLLFAGGEEDDDVWGKAGSSRQDELATKMGGKFNNGDMEITFRPGLSVSKAGEGEDDGNLTTLEEYQMRMKERKARKKEKMELKRATKEDEPAPSSTKVNGDDFFGEESESDEERPKPAAAPARKIVLDDSGDDNGIEHFSIKDIIKAEQAEGKKRKRKRPGKGPKGPEFEREVELGPTDWRIDVKDSRFKALHEEPEFAIDPSNPQCIVLPACDEARLTLRMMIASQRPRR